VFKSQLCSLLHNCRDTVATIPFPNERLRLFLILGPCCRVSTSSLSLVTTSCRSSTVGTIVVGNMCLIVKVLHVVAQFHQPLARHSFRSKLRLKIHTFLTKKRMCEVCRAALRCPSWPPVTVREARSGVDSTRRVAWHRAGPSALRFIVRFWKSDESMWSARIARCPCLSRLQARSGVPILPNETAPG
jgi:hypothetical protein